MRKNFRKTPEFILQQLDNIESDDVTIATIKKITNDDFDNEFYSQINLNLNNGELNFIDEFVPLFTNGSFSRKNVKGYKIRYPDRPKVSKTYYLGERAIFGDFNKGSFSLYVTRMVTPYDVIPPKEISICVEHLETTDEDGVIFHSLKFSTNQILNKNANNFIEELFFNINLLQENIGSVNVYNSNTSIDEYLQTLQLNWEIFPPGTMDQDLSKITNGLRNITPQRANEIIDRYSFLRSENPIQTIIGNSGMRRYFGVKFSESLVAFENSNYGNALYILFENWRELSRLSRLDIQNRPSDQFIRVEHRGNWKEKVKAIIKAKK
ncbi:MAG: hypothetical protein Q8K70_01355 [Bacteroidota bacterium]|nr:hypothetical protein [Bacteroidota bacterium]